MNNAWAFLPMRASSSLLGDAAALRERMDEDGYLYLPKLLDPAPLRRLRERMLDVLERHGWIAGGEWLMDAMALGPAVDEGKAEFAAAYDAVQRLEELHALAHDERLVAAMQQVVGPTAFPHPLKIARLVFPANYEVTTPPHQDYPNNQGTPGLTASWIPLGDCPQLLGPLAILRGSHRAGMLPLEVHPGPGNRQARIPQALLETLRWVTTDFALGDVLLFGAYTVHASLHNASEVHLRLSVDFRYQQEGEALTPPCLEPHFGRQSWDQVYAGWTSARWQYYWKGLDYRVVPFRAFPVHGAHVLAGETDAALGSAGEVVKDAVASGEVELTPAQWSELLRTESRRSEREKRRVERVEALIARGRTESPEKDET